MKKTNDNSRLGKLSMHPLTLDEALKGAMEVPPPDDAKPKKKRSTKKKSAKRARTKK